jgi:hypothetical protein
VVYGSVNNAKDEIIPEVVLFYPMGAYSIMCACVSKWNATVVDMQLFSVQPLTSERMAR